MLKRRNIRDTFVTGKKEKLMVINCGAFKLEFLSLQFMLKLIILENKFELKVAQGHVENVMQWVESRDKLLERRKFESR